SRARRRVVARGVGTPTQAGNDFRYGVGGDRRRPAGRGSENRVVYSGLDGLLQVVVRPILFLLLQIRQQILEILAWAEWIKGGVCPQFGNGVVTGGDGIFQGSHGSLSGRLSFFGQNARSILSRQYGQQGLVAGQIE